MESGRGFQDRTLVVALYTDDVTQYDSLWEQILLRLSSDLPSSSRLRHVMIGNCYQRISQAHLQLGWAGSEFVAVDTEDKATSPKEKISLPG